MVQEHVDIFVGREEELKQLHKRFGHVIDGNYQICFVAGEAGTGKTTLLERFLQEASQRVPDLLIARGRCTSESELSGLSPFIQVLGDLYNLNLKRVNLDRDDDRFKRFLVLLKDIAPAWGDVFVGGVISAIKTTFEEGQKFFTPQTPQATSFTQLNIFEQYTNLLIQKATEKCVIIFLDDLQWIDRSSLDLLFYLSRELKSYPVMILGAYRSSAVIDEENHFLRIKNDIIRFGGFELPELKRGIDIVEYAAKRFPKHSFPPSFLKAFQERTEGYALFVQQLFDWLQEQGHITAKLDPIRDEIVGWNLDNPEGVMEYVPQSVQAVIANRLQRLENILREILTYSSVEGEYFTAQVIARLQKRDEIDLLDDLEKLEQQYRLVKEVGEQELTIEIVISSYRFAHRLFKDYLYEHLGQARRRVLHLQVGEFLEALYQEQASLIADQLAAHFQLARQLEKASHYSLLAAQVAHARYSWPEAISWAKTTYNLIEKLPESEINLTYQTEAIIIWEECAQSTGEFRDVVPYLKTLVNALSRKESLKELLARVLVAWGWNSYYGDGSELEIVARQAVRIAEEVGDLIGIYNAKYLLSQTLIDVLGKYEEGREVLIQHLEIAKKLGDVEKQAYSLSLLSWCLWFLGYYEEAVANASESLSLIENDSDDPAALGFSLRCLGSAFQGQGNYKLAIQAQRKALNVYERQHDALQANWCRIDLSETLCAMGTLEEAYSLLMECVSFAEDVHDFSLAFEAYVDLAELNLEKDNLMEAEKNLDQARRIYEAYGYDSITDKIKLNTTFVKSYREKKDFQRAQDCIKETLSLLPEVESRVPALIFYDVCGTVLLAEGRFDQAEDWYQKSLIISEQLNARVWMAITYQHLGFLYQSQGKMDMAQDFYQRALQIRQDLHHHWMVDGIETALSQLTLN